MWDACVLEFMSLAALLYNLLVPVRTLLNGKVTHIRNLGRFHASVRGNLFCLRFMGLSSARYNKSSKSIVSFRIKQPDMFGLLYAS
jgi:hypothetical protein